MKPRMSVPASLNCRRDHVVAGLVEKRREPAGIIDELQRRLDQHRADLIHIDGTIRVLATDLDPETIRPKRAYRRNRYFARNELSRLCLGVLRREPTPRPEGDRDPPNFFTV
jgi:hypothetical protein